MAAAADSFCLEADINPLMEEFCEGSGRAVEVAVTLLAVVGLFHALALLAALVIWLFEKATRRGD